LHRALKRKFYVNLSYNILLYRGYKECLCDTHGGYHCDCGILGLTNFNGATMTLENALHPGGGLNISFTDDNQTLNIVIKDIMEH
jgi:hypothetical protein